MMSLLDFKQSKWGVGVGGGACDGSTKSSWLLQIIMEEHTKHFNIVNLAQDNVTALKSSERKVSQ